ncbi:MAG: low molecular weight phosphatase family protein [Bacteroidia bacterium]
MKKATFITFLITLISSFTYAQKVIFNKKLQIYCYKVQSSFNEIPENRKQLLKEISDYIVELAMAGKPININYICTHNSRRSQFGQVWMQTAALWYGIENVYTYSGGTEATAFNIRAAMALKRAGFSVAAIKTADNQNTPYEIKQGRKLSPMVLFSKKYDNLMNPKKDFMAIMVCSEADKSCPNVEGADFRIAIPYDDPKYFDNTASESIKYDERCRQIAIEQFYIMNLVKQELIVKAEKKK